MDRYGVQRERSIKASVLDKRRHGPSEGRGYKDLGMGGRIVLSFENIGKGLAASGSTELKQFTIAGADGRFQLAKAKIRGNRVEVWNDEVKNPVAVRYAWADHPEGANLCSKDGLPAPPFRTDRFPI